MVAGVEGGAEGAGLGAGVVDVVLALDVVARGFEDGGDGVAEHRAAAVADVEGAGGVGGDELDLDAVAPAEGDVAPGGTGVDDGVDLGALPVEAEADVDEAGRSDADLADEVAGFDAGGDLLGDLQRLALDGAGEAERDGAGVIAVLGLLGAFDFDLAGDGREGALRLGGVQRGGDRGVDLVAYEVGHGSVSELGVASRKWWRSRETPS